MAKHTISILFQGIVILLCYFRTKYRTKSTVGIDDIHLNGLLLSALNRLGQFLKKHFLIYRLFQFEIVDMLHVKNLLIGFHIRIIQNLIQINLPEFVRQAFLHL